MKKWNGKLKAVTFSYDDGVTQDVALIEMLNKYGLKCTFNINSEFLGRGGFLPRNGQRIAHYKVKPEDVKSVYDGHEVAVHTLTHPFLPDLDDREIIRQVEEDRKNLSELTGYNVVGMAYPCGGANNDDRVAALIKENTGVKYSRTITSTENFDTQDNLYRFNPSIYHLEFDKLMELGEKFINLSPDSRQIFYIWGHSYELDYEPDYRNKLDEFFKMISGHNDIFYGTNTEVLL